MNAIRVNLLATKARTSKTILLTVTILLMAGFLSGCGTPSVKCDTTGNSTCSVANPPSVNEINVVVPSNDMYLQIYGNWSIGNRGDLLPYDYSVSTGMGVDSNANLNGTYWTDVTFGMNHPDLTVKLESSP